MSFGSGPAQYDAVASAAIGARPQRRDGARFRPDAGAGPGQDRNTFEGEVVTQVAPNSNLLERT